LGGAGCGFGTSALLRASSSFREASFVTTFFAPRGFGRGFLAEGLFAAATFLLLLADDKDLFFFVSCAFLASSRLVSLLLAAACFTFLVGGSFFAFAAFFPLGTGIAARFTLGAIAIAAFFALGAAVILPGRSGFREEAFLPFVACFFGDEDEGFLVAFVIRPLISLLGVENEPALRLNPAHTLVYGSFISIIPRQVKKIPLQG